METLTATALEALHNRTASKTCRLLDFDDVEVRPGFVDGTWILIVQGKAPCGNMRIDLVPLVYITRPDYWEIELVGCLSGPICLPQRPFIETRPLDGTLGTAGIEVVGATRRKRIDVPPAAGPDGPVRR
jgi:hypothetical protein